MNLHRLLEQRQRQGNPVRVGLIGAGKFASMYLAQIPRTPGVHIAGIADLAPANVHTNLKRIGWEPAAYGAALYRTPPMLSGPTGRKTPAVEPIARFL